MMTVYMKSNCPRCEELKKILDTKRIAYKVVNLDDPTALSEFKLAHPYVKSVPFYVGNFISFL